MLLKRGRNCTMRDAKRATNLLMSPTSVAIKGIYNITLADREPGSWLLKN